MQSVADAVQEIWRPGQAGQKILRARDRVLEILQSENACSAWFREKDPAPAATFRTLSFEIDRKGMVPSRVEGLRWIDHFSQSLRCR